MIRLSDGDVMDYVKDSAPYKDERFCDAQAQEPLSGAVATKSTKTDLAAVAYQSPETANWQFIQYPSPVTIPYTPPAVTALQTDSNQVSRDVLSEVLEKVQARKDALDAMDDKTVEIKATIKALDWVIVEINKSRARS